MIKLLKQGSYTLIETLSQTKILTLDKKQAFAWVWAQTIGEILVSTRKPHKTDHILAEGQYSFFDVLDEPDLIDVPHLQLTVGKGKLQGYLLPTGLPNDIEKRKRIIPTKEVVSVNLPKKELYKSFS